MTLDLDMMVSVVQRGLVAGTPLLLGTLGEILAERSGVMNLGVEGLMAVGAMAGFAVAVQTGSPWLGVAAALLVGMLLASIHALVTITFRANQVVAGLALTMLGLGLSSLWGKPYVGMPLANSLSPVAIPGFSQIPVLGRLLFTRDPLFYLGVVLTVGLWFLLFRTRWGIIIRSVGENPLAAASCGISVARVRYACVLAGGAFGGLAGGYLSLVYNPSWIEGMTAGRGWIVIALTIFAFWNPWRAFLGAYLFGVIEVMQYPLQAWNVPAHLLLMLPYLATLGALIFSARRAERSLLAPTALGIPYFDGEKSET